MEGDALYFQRRASQEKEAARKAEHPAARDAHIELASRYEEFASAILSQEGKSRLRGHGDLAA